MPSLTNTSLTGKGFKAMLLAAGLGTRLKPWTDYHPKALAMVNGKSLLQRNVEYLQSFGITEVVVNVHHFAQQIIDAVQTSNGWGSQITISNEENEVLETGGGLQKAAWYFEETENFVVMNTDILTQLDMNKMISQHLQNQALATLAVTERETSRYFLFNANNQLCGWRNVKTGEEKIPNPQTPLYQKAFSGIHVINKKLFTLIQQTGKFSMVDVYLGLAATQNIMCYDHTGIALLDVGKPESIIKAEAIFK
jgi:N-acetyl-alpha-D-muramate 1-phosphate uridylyltransferase